jgi:predicted DNA-binding antitoxin AbrB/MazE fold protein
MTRRLKAVYRGGAFVPLERCDLPEGSEGRLRRRGTTQGGASVSVPSGAGTNRERCLLLVVTRVPVT